MEKVQRPKNGHPEPFGVQEIFDFLDDLERRRKIPVYVRIELRKLIRKLAELDGLTRCLKKEYFQQEMLKAVHPDYDFTASDRRNPDRRSRWLTLWVIDISHFKAINDTLGHLIGDAVLSRIGRILRSSLRHRQRIDFAGRMGGDEFAALLTQVTTSTGGKEAAERFVSRVKKRHWSGISEPLGSVLFPRPDIGVVALNTDTTELITDRDEVEHVCQRWYYYADLLMYRSKKDGDIYFRCMGYDRAKADLVEVDSEYYQLTTNLLNRRHL